MKNHGVPAVIGHAGTVLGNNRVNIANFSLGRRDVRPRAREPLEAVAVVGSDCEAIANSVARDLRQR